MSELQPSGRVWHLTVAGGEARPPESAPAFSPIDHRPLEPIATTGEAEVRAAVARARVAQDDWRTWPLAERAASLKRAAKEMLRRRDEVIELASRELGKVEVEGLFNEALGPLETLAGWLKVVERAAAIRTVRLNPLSFPRKTAQVELVPRGVVGVIAAWNFPVAGLYRSTFPALLTGNGVVVKPSEYTPRTSAWFLRCLAAELPDGLVQTVQGPGQVGATLIDSGIDACVFTGSPSSGRKVQVRCAERGIPASVEMGGKDAAIVLADCDQARTAAGLTHWALSNVGQSCGAIEIAYVDKQIADSLVGRLGAAWAKLRLGSDRFADLGPMGNLRQFEIVAGQVADARDKGAKVVCGGEAVGPTREGLWFPATLLDHCTDEMSVVRDETFGPVLAVVRVSGAEEAIRRVNAGKYGLGASIWTRRPRSRPAPPRAAWTSGSFASTTTTSRAPIRRCRGAEPGQPAPGSQMGPRPWRPSCDHGRRWWMRPRGPRPTGCPTTTCCGSSGRYSPTRRLAGWARSGSCRCCFGSGRRS